jgi:hypothetical protein
VLGVAYRGSHAFGGIFPLGSGDRTGSEVCSGIGPEPIVGNTGAKLGRKDAERGEIPLAWQCGQIRLSMSLETGGFIQNVCHPELHRSHKSNLAKACVNLQTSQGLCRSGRYSSGAKRGSMFGKWHGVHCSTCAFNNEIYLPCSVPLPITCLTLRIADLVSGDRPPFFLLICVHIRTY